MTHERRSQPRYRTSVPATVVSANGLNRLLAKIIERSPDGIRLRLSVGASIEPGSYVLFGHSIESCRVVWQTKNVVGVAFEIPQDVEEPRPIGIRR